MRNRHRTRRRPHRCQDRGEPQIGPVSPFDRHMKIPAHAGRLECKPGPGPAETHRHLVGESPDRFSSNATVPWPPAAQMLTIARQPLGMAASALMAWFRMRAPVAANGWPNARLPRLGFTRPRENRPTTSSASTAGLTSAPAGVLRWCRPRGWSECASRSIAPRRGPCTRPGDSLRVAP